MQLPFTSEFWYCWLLLDSDCCFITSLIWGHFRISQLNLYVFFEGNGPKLANEKKWFIGNLSNVLPMDAVNAECIDPDGPPVHHLAVSGRCVDLDQTQKNPDQKISGACKAGWRCLVHLFLIGWLLVSLLACQATGILCLAHNIASTTVGCSEKWARLGFGHWVYDFFPPLLNTRDSSTSVGLLAEELPSNWQRSSVHLRGNSW